MILELDLGNTRAKWRTLNDGQLTGQGVGAVAAWCAGELPAWQGVTRVRVASVVGDVIERAVAAALAVLGVPVEFARTTSECAGVVNAYKESQRLGVDRWLAMLAAYREFQRAIVVVDAGSALTLDWVDASGVHQGGYIIPGARLMADALLRSTDRVRFDEGAQFASLEPGRSTGECVQHGIALALAGAVRVGVSQARAQLGAVELILAGGDAQALGALLADERPHLRRDLVLEGLRWALP